MSSSAFRSVSACSVWNVSTSAGVALAHQPHGVGLDAVEQRRRQHPVGNDTRRLEIFGHDGGGRAEVWTDVVEGRGGGLVAPDVVVDDDMRRHVGGQRVVAGAGLRVNQGNTGGALEDGFGQRSQWSSQIAHQRLVLGAPDDSLVGDLHREGRALVQQLLQTERAGDGVGVGVVVRQDQHLIRAGNGTQQLVETALAHVLIISGSRGKATGGRGGRPLVFALGRQHPNAIKCRRGSGVRGVAAVLPGDQCFGAGHR